MRVRLWLAAAALALLAACAINATEQVAGPVVLHDGEYVEVVCECAAATPILTETSEPPAATSTPRPTDTPEPTATPTPRPTYAPPPPISGKKGVGLTWGNCPGTNDGRDAVTLGVDWTVTWGTNPILVPGVEAVPMIWGRFSGCPTLGGNSDYVLGFNEPGLEEQSNMPPLVGAVYWRRLEQCYPHKRLVSPATVRFDTLDNSWWLEEMRNEYIDRYDEPPRFDVLALHCYASGANPLRTICNQQVNKFAGWAEDWNIPEGIWVTEFAQVTTSETAMVYFLDRTVSWMESNPAIDRYAWFSTRLRGDESYAFGGGVNTSLVDCDTGALTAAGREYVKY